ncbi:xanthine dehydrogenase accessory protein XdhC [Mesorhizobium sp. M7A.F.Ca.AU.002.02.1.1]|uniref:xanthine dehydrogenase accessory protein XdhC n=1 Tax=Mesorhizobium sp. M7A.F.Ca.AU.002.02.1.1 TaxID=2496671 RepID=UPI000FCC0013|nr:xanthine dehydrogenase accessory protein XdhC [Mesorhizobium sp. M7A.F.Ca.AU.002.02.1.1]RVC24694.1 xanthine dehydrogenase accessory protein XdhC [Mesorhizobium sp. M7A.F.Ca.AU.002.02.1.1]
MNSKVQSLKAFLASAGRVAVVEVAGTKGSTPREKGAFMLVSPTAIFGTIGGGQLEYMAIDKARQMLGKEARIEVDEVCATLDVPLGPEIGQCCGGRVEVLIRLVDAALAGDLVAAAEAEEAHLPYVYIFGGGHVGQALASAIALLPVHGVVIETRAEALEGMPETIETRLTAMPEAMVRNAPAGAAFAILTHDHALDFLIVAEALKRGDTAYVGMISSKTKKATFRTWFLKSADGSQAEFARLVSPIGGDTVKDKRPQVIAALAAAEIMTALVNHNAALNADHQIPHGKVMAS